MSGTINFSDLTSWGGGTASLETWFDFVAAAVRTKESAVSDKLRELFSEESRGDMETVTHLNVKGVSHDDYEFLKQTTIALIVGVPESIPNWVPEWHSQFVQDACRLLCSIVKAQASIGLKPDV
ncbi:MAG: hypothetical protein U0640_08105 [Phycisphaerales bacterium]